MHTLWFTLLHHRLTFATTAVVYCYKSWKMSPKHSNSGVGTVATCYGFGHTSFSPYNAKYSWAVSCLFADLDLLHTYTSRWWSQHIIMHGTIFQWTEKSEEQVAGPGPLPLHHYRDAAILPWHGDLSRKSDIRAYIHYPTPKLTLHLPLLTIQSHYHLLILLH